MTTLPPAIQSDDDDIVLLRAGLAATEAQRMVVLLASMGVASAVGPDERGAVGVYVDRANVETGRRILADEPEQEKAHTPQPRTPSLSAPTGWFGRGSGAVLAVAAWSVAVFILSMQGSDADTRTRWLELGAIQRNRVAAGEAWRLFTAIFVHFNVGHLLSNLSVLLFVGPPLAHWVGASRFLFVFVASGIGGNVASYFLAPTLGLKAGASGAIAGVLGALGGQALRPTAEPRRRKAWQTLGALAALYGLLVGFAPQSDHVAHVAGLLVGLLLGRVISSP